MKQTIGRQDYLDFPELQISDVLCKIDTGAYMSALHCKEMSVEDNVLKFKFGKHPNFKFPDKTYQTEKFTVKEITSSNGESEKRYTITTSIRVFNEDIETVFTLTDRTTMNMPVLIGRLALKNLLVDVTKTNVSFQHKYKFKN